MELKERRAQATLKEKLSDHYRKREFKPSKRDISNLGVNFFWGMTFSLFFISQFILIPNLFSGWYMIGMIALVWFTMFETTINWMGMYFGSTSYVEKELRAKHFPEATENPTGWQYCLTCQVDAPPRSFHCSYCNACVLKRDHHCFFSNSCIGFYNQRFFMLFILYMVWGTIFALYLLISYLNEFHPITSYYEILTFFPLATIAQFLLGYLSFLNAFVIILIVLCLLCLAAAIFFLIFEIMLMCKGMTSYEMHKTGPIYDKGLGNNIRSIFGPIKTIPLQIICPLFPVDQQNDGSKWEYTRIKGQ
ncbi:probable palmitoyltransferase ZDHHC24 [Saccostrea echinata]|uniref:probable palmitoyltransferase ZDHHC24 n=1 Tax=Saccostrea echinata TaxID=191078 RepID=UPI002A81D6AA|nr:probable palmitoyltransferase ZDHHC24 [Saccostrea echinata]